MMAFSLVACGEYNHSSPNNSRQKQQSTTPSQNVLTVIIEGESVNLNDEEEAGKPVINENIIPITITVGETIITATLDNSKTSQELIDSLPKRFL
jgi:hypothetical protein